MKKLIFTLLILISAHDAFTFERSVLAEIFTSTTCPPCAQQNPIFDSWYSNYPQKNRVTVIKYHTWWPSPGNDPFYLSNVSENRGRVLYYWPSLNTYVPRCQVNGLIDAGEYASDWSNQIINQLSVSSPLEMKITLESGNVKISVTADNSILPSGTYVLHLAVVESKIAYTGTNGDPVHNYVMRKMFPDQNGETFSITSNQTVNFSKSVQWNPNWKIQNCEVIAFVQIKETKEVLQSAKAKFNLLQSPILIYPANNATQIPSIVTFNWNGVSNMSSLLSGTKYQLQVAEDSNFSNVAFAYSDLIDTNKTVSGLLGDKKYYWRVKAYTDSGISNWSAVWTFNTVLSLPNKVILNSPPNNSLVTVDNQLNVEFKWNRENSSISKYWIEFAIDSLFQLAEIDSNVTDTFYLGRLSEMFDTYYWRVKAYNLSGWGEFSDVWKFKTTFTAVDEESYPDEYVLEQNFPNPFNPTTTIKYYLPIRSKIRISIYDLLGKELLVLVDDEIDRGYHFVNFSAMGLASGAYYYQLKSDNNTIIKKMLVVK